MNLYGSDTSPYARRLRIWAKRNNIELNYIHLDIFSEEGRATLTQYNPAKKIPFLLDDTQAICDSNVIFRYLSQKCHLSPLTWSQENDLTTINACNDSLIELLISVRSGFDIQEDKLFFSLQRERIATTLQVLNERCQTSEFLDCSYLNISLYCLLDWIVYRDLFDLSPYEALLTFLKVEQSNVGISQTDPRI